MKRTVITWAVTLLLVFAAVVYAGWKATYTELAATPAADDFLLIVDLSDLDMAATGTTKWISYDNLLSNAFDPDRLNGDTTDDNLLDPAIGGAGADTSSMSGIAKLTSGVVSQATEDVDYATARFTKGLTMGSFTNGDATPDVSNGETGLKGNAHLWQTANAGATTITDFDDGDDHSEFANGDWFTVLCDDANTTIDCTSNANFECPTDVDFVCSADHPRVIGWQFAGTSWKVMFGIGPGGSSPGVYTLSAIDMGSGVVEIPNGASPTVDATGEIAVDTTSDQFQFYGGSAKKVIPTVQAFSIVVPSVAATDDLMFIKLPWGITVTNLDCIVTAATSATINIVECNGTGTCSDEMATDDLACDTDGATTSTFGGAAGSAADSGDWLQLKVESISGTPGTLTVTLRYTVTAD